MCVDKKVIAGLAVAGLAVVVLAPNWVGAALPLLVLAVCPLSMIAMMRFMGSSAKSGGTDESASVSAELARLRTEVAQLRRQSTEREECRSPRANP